MARSVRRPFTLGREETPKQCAPGRVRTSNLRLSRPVLCPVELRGRNRSASRSLRGWHRCVGRVPGRPLRGRCPASGIVGGPIGRLERAFGPPIEQLLAATTPVTSRLTNQELLFVIPSLVQRLAQAASPCGNVEKRAISNALEIPALGRAWNAGYFPARELLQRTATSLSH